MKALFGFIFLIAFIFGITTLAAYSVENNGLPDILNEFLPESMQKDQTGPDPADTLVAPFADPGEKTAAPDDNALAIPYTPETTQNIEEDLTQPHRNKTEIEDWLTKVTASILTIEPETYKKHLAAMEKILDKYAMNDFKDFMASSNILSTLQGHNLKLHAYVEDTPQALNAGVIEGRYRWLYEVPLTMSFLPKNVTSYEAADSDDILTESVIIKLQIGRSGTAGLEGIMIESWDVRRNKNKD